MNKYCDIIEYDKIGRIISIYIKVVGIQYNYEYNDENRARICTIFSENNKSNYKTTIYQNLTDNDEYIDCKSITEGDTYDLEIKYDELGKEIELKRVNKKSNTNYKKTTFRNKLGTPKIWIEEYDKKKSIGFKVDMNKIMN